MRAYRGTILNPRGENHCAFYEDGLLVVNDAGQVGAIGATEAVAKRFGPKSLEIVETKTLPLILPAFSDIHLHWVQNRVKGTANGQGLLPWLNEHVWPEEARFVDAAYAKEAATQFFGELSRNGTMVGAVYSSIHETALAAFDPPFGYFVVGNVLMTRNSPAGLTQSEDDALMLVERWAKKLNRGTPHLNPLPQGERKEPPRAPLSKPDHLSPALSTRIHLVDHGKNRERAGRGQGEGCLHYAVSPRFAPTCSMELMKGVGEIAKRNGCFVQTHLSENLDEVAWVHNLFPDCRNYTEVYHRAGLLGPRTILGHCIYLDDDELSMLKAVDAVIAHCPTSNEALASGRMPIERIRKADIRWALASDIAAGPSLSMLHIMKTFLRVHADAGLRCTPAEALYRATLAGAEILGLGERCGNLDVGKEANFLLFDPPPNLRARAHDANDMLSALLCMAEVDFSSIIRHAFFRGNAIFSR